MSKTSLLTLSYPKFKNATAGGVRLIGMLLLVSLVGCGFQLRGTGQATSLLESVYLDLADKNSELARELTASLTQSGVEFTTSGKAQVSIQLDRERFSRRSVSTTGQINVAEYELNLLVSFNVLDANGEVLIPHTRIQTERIYTFDSSSLVGSNEEEAVLHEEMRRDLVVQLLQRVNARMRSEKILKQPPASTAG
ncbi:MAG: LPS-assembly lipoprotein [Candidatus Azotimanducaceae bacterium]|jgi:LPS-assembly lipoprotein